MESVRIYEQFFSALSGNLVDADWESFETSVAAGYVHGYPWWEGAEASYVLNVCCCTRTSGAFPCCFWLSFHWNCRDLASDSDRICKQKYLASVVDLILMNGLVFVSFWTLLITNGVVLNHMPRALTILTL